MQILKKIRRKLSTVNNSVGAQRTDQLDFFPVPYHLRNLSIVKKVAKDRSKRIAPERSTIVFNAVRNDKDPLNKLEQKGSL